MADASSVVIHTSRLKLTTLLVANMVFGMMIITWAKQHEEWLLYAFAAFVALLNAGGLWAALFRRATLTLDSAGLRLTRGKKQRWSLAWRDLAGMHLVDTRINGVRTNRVLVLVDRQGVERNVASSLTLTPDQLAALIGERMSLAAEPAS